MDKKEIDRLVKLHAEIVNSSKDLMKAISDYTGYQFKTLNAHLRQGVALTATEERVAHRIDSMFESLQPIKETLTLYRGIKQEDQVNNKNAFVSASHDISVAKGFVGKECCLLVITIPPGSKVLFIEDVSRFPKEREVLIERTGGFAITLIDNDAYKVTKIFTTYIPIRAVHASTHTLDSVVDAASTQVSAINKVISIILRDGKSQDEKSQDRNSQYGKSFIEKIYTDVTDNAPTDNEIVEIINKIAQSKQLRPALPPKPSSLRQRPALPPKPSSLRQRPALPPKPSSLYTRI